MIYVYVLSNEQGLFYTGCTTDLKKRLAEHNSGMSTYTRGKGPYTLLYYEACLDSNDAFAREKYLKSGPGKHYIGNRLKGYLKKSMNPVRPQETTSRLSTSRSKHRGSTVKQTQEVKWGLTG